MAIRREIKIANDYLDGVLSGNTYMLLDGGLGTLIQSEGLHEVHPIPDLLNLTHPQEITSIQERYVEAGCDCITTNTFNSNRLKLEGSGASVREIYRAAVKNARNAGARLVAGDIGPIGKLLEPLGTVSFEEAFEIFAEQATSAEDSGCDLILIETMTDLLEAKAAVLACVESTSLPVFATMTFDEDGRTFLGTTPTIAASTLSSLGASAVGINCSLGPDEIAPLVIEASRFARSAVIVQPNAGLPHMDDGKTVFDVGAIEFAHSMRDIIEAGATIIGGCCGTTPEHIAELRALVNMLPDPNGSHFKPAFTVTSAQQMVSLPAGEERTAIIGERINPTGRTLLKKALESKDMDHLIGEAVRQQRAGADILDVNVGVPGLDERAVLVDAVQALQATVTIPLQLDSSDVSAIEGASRIYSGRPMINSVNGKPESLESILPIAAHYGCTVVGLTLDNDGIPSTAEGRLDIARRIVEAAEEHGVPREDVSIDCLVMSAATNQEEVKEILRAVALVKERLGVRTVLGVSNISFGLPERSLVNSTFLATAFGAGLDMPILDPLNARYRDTVATFRLLIGQDAGCESFLASYSKGCDPCDSDESASPGNHADGILEHRMGAKASEGTSTCPISVAETFEASRDEVARIAEFAIEGRMEQVEASTRRLLERYDGLSIVNEIFVPILDVIGQKYDDGSFFLPQLMASAEAVKAGFDIIRAEVVEDGSTIEDDNRSIIVATVQGDIHDIGKNIAKMLLKNYGFNVIDLGKDVAPETIIDAAKKSGAGLIGLSALMTTTVKAMEDTIKLAHDQIPGVKVLVGGAVITQDFAKEIGADFYAKDAAASARIASRLFADAGL